MCSLSLSIENRRRFPFCIIYFISVACISYTSYRWVFTSENDWSETVNDYSGNDPMNGSVSIAMNGILDTNDTYSVPIKDVRIYLPLSKSKVRSNFYHNWDCVAAALFDSYLNNEWSDLDRERIIFHFPNDSDSDWKVANSGRHLIELINQTFTAEFTDPKNINRTFANKNRLCARGMSYPYPETENIRHSHIRFQNEFRYFMAKQWKIDNLMAYTNAVRSNSDTRNRLIQTIENRALTILHENYTHMNASQPLNIEISASESRLMKNVVFIVRDRNRLIYNLSGLISDLSEIFGNGSNFTVLKPTDYHLWDIGRIVSKATLIITAHGANEVIPLTTAPSNATVIEVSPFNYHCYPYLITSYYWSRSVWLRSFHTYASLLPNTTCDDIRRRYPFNNGKNRSRWRGLKWIYVDSKTLAKLIITIENELENTNDTTQLRSFFMDSYSLYDNKRPW